MPSTSEVNSSYYLDGVSCVSSMVDFSTSLYISTNSTVYGVDGIKGRLRTSKDYGDSRI